MSSTIDAQRARLLERSPHLVPTPIDAEFYADVRAKLPTAVVRNRFRLDDLSGAAVDVRAGETLDLRLLEGPQIVNLFAFNSADPDERIWHQSVIREGLFTTRGTRIWGTMARNRPLLTVVEDTVCADPRHPFGQHHIYFGGSGTPADWHFAGGAPGVRTTWEQFAGLLEQRGVDPAAVLLENVCFFQKSTIDQLPMRVEMMASDAVAGDHVTLFSEIDLVVLLALSPYEDGGRPAHQIGIPQPKAVEISVSEPVAEPLPWPYQGISYPDLGRYLDGGRRTREPVSTPGIDYRLRPAGNATNGKADQ